MLDKNKLQSIGEWATMLKESASGWSISAVSLLSSLGGLVYLTTENCEYTLIERMPKTIFKALFGLIKPPISSLILVRPLPKYKSLSIFFMLLKLPPFLHLLLSRFYSLHKVETMNKNYWRFFPLLTSVIFLKVLFSKGLEDISQNFIHKNQEAI